MTHIRMTDEKKAELLAMVEADGNVTMAAKRAGVSRNSVYYQRKVDPDFDAAMEEAIEVAIAKLENEARRRAVDGVDKPVYQQGQLVGHVTEYSDKLLEMLLRAHRPEKYRDNNSTPGGVTVNILSFADGTQKVELVPAPTQEPLDLQPDDVKVLTDGARDNAPA